MSDREVAVKITAQAGQLETEAGRAANSMRDLGNKVRAAATDVGAAGRDIGGAMHQAAGQVDSGADKAGNSVTSMGKRILGIFKSLAHEAKAGFADGMRQGYNEVVKASDDAADKVERNTKRMHAPKGGGGGIGGVIAGLGLGAAVVGAVAGTVSTIAEYEKLGASLKTFTGSQAAANAQLQELAKLGATTPYQLAELTQGFTTLKSRGLDSSIAALTSWGNMASAMGKPYQQMIEAVADAGTGEFERLKEFGVNAKKQGDQVAFTFGGVTTKVANNATEIQKYLKNLSDTKFGGAMAEQSATLAGQWSNTQDVAAGFAAAVGVGGLSGALQGVLRDINAAGAGAQGFGLQVGQVLGAAITGTWEALKNFGAVIAPAFQQLQGLAPVVQPLVTALTGLGKAVLNAVGPLVKTAIDAIIPAFRTLAPAVTPLVNAIKDLFNQFMATFGPSLKVLITGTISVITIAIKSISGVVTQVVQAVTALLRGDFVGAWNHLKGAIGAALNGLIDTIKGIFANIGNLMATIGGQIVDGIKQGFERKKQEAIAAVRGLGTDISNNFKSVLGIRSPSREFAEHGENIVQGAINGISARYNDLMSAVRRLGTGAVQNMRDAVKGLLDSLMTDSERAYKAYDDDMAILVAAHKKGIISTKEMEEAMGRLHDRLAEATGTQVKPIEIATVSGDAIKAPSITSTFSAQVASLPPIQPYQTFGQRIKNVFKEAFDFKEHFDAAGNKIETLNSKLQPSFRAVHNGFANAISGMITGATTWRDAMLQMGQQVLNNLIDIALQSVEKWIWAQVTKTGVTAAQTTAQTGIEAAGAATSTGISATSALVKIGHSAAVAAAGAYQAIAGIHIVGPVLAPLAAAAALTGVMALGKSIFSARGGFDRVPKDGAITELHKDEMVLSAKYANPLRDMLQSSSAPIVGRALANGNAGALEAGNVAGQRASTLSDQIAAMQARGGAGAQINIKAFGAKDVKRLLENGAPDIKKGLKRLARDGSL